MSNQTSTPRPDQKPAQRVQESQYTMPSLRSASRPASSQKAQPRVLSCGELDLLS
jgi:hypothetical protein